MQVRTWGTVGLAHARMVMTPEDVLETQPLISPRTGGAIVADAHLDNREDLLAGLADRPRAAHGDAELILRAYETWGIEAASHLLGDFALVLWIRATAACSAPGHSGQRCLYYRFDRRTFAVASEIHQLLQDPSVPVEPNEERIRDYLVPWNMIRNGQGSSGHVL